MVVCKADRMRARSLIFAAVFLCGTVVFAQAGLTSSERKVVDLLNQERVNAGLAKLEWNDHLVETARAHSALQASRTMLSHQFPGEAVLGDRIGATGLRFDLGAENVAVGGSVEDIHTGLMGSPLHRANILSPNYNSIGVAIVARDGELWLTEDFARTLPEYSEEQFRDAVVKAFNRTRQANSITSIAAIANPHLHELACSGSDDAQHMMEGLPGALTLVIFTSSSPDKLSPTMQRAAAEKTWRRLDLGVCFKPGKEHGYGSFRILAALY